jgi:hypothetical protein
MIELTRGNLLEAKAEALVIPEYRGRDGKKALP